MRQVALFFAVFLLAACSPAQPQAQPSAQSAVASSGTGQPSSLPVQSSAPINPPKEEAPEASAPSPGNFELQGVRANVWTVLAGETHCVDLSSMRRSCVELGDSLYPGSGSLFLDVSVELKNLGDRASSIGVHDLIATLGDRRLRYRLARNKESNEIEVPPLGRAVVTGEYEVPVEVLNSASFAIDMNAGDPLPVSFQTPAQAEEDASKARQEASMIDASQRVADEDAEQRRRKCWSLNDKTTVVSSADEFQWYVDNCQHLFEVGTYQAYRLSHD